MTNLGTIYGTKIDGSNTLVIDFSNVDICGNLKVKGGLAIDNSFGVSGEVLTSQGTLGTPIWRVIPAPVLTAGNGIDITGTTISALPSAFGAFNLAHNLTIAGTVIINNIVDDTTLPTPYGMTKTLNANIQLAQAGVYRFTWHLNWNYTNPGTSLGAFLINSPGINIHRENIWFGPTWGTISGSRVINVTAGQTFYFQGQTVSSFVLIGGSNNSSISITRLF